MKCQINTLFLILILGAPFCLSQPEERWVECSGEAVVQNITNEEAQVIAKRRARRDAIEKVCGIQLQAESLVQDYVLAGDFIHAIAYGHVVEEKNLSWETETLPPENPSTPPVILLRLTMNAKVIPINDMPDPYFKLNLNLNRNVFQSGDEVILRVKSTKDCYITVLNLAADDSVYVLFPNISQRDNFIDAEKSVEIPSKAERESGFHIRVRNLPGHKKDTELVTVIATKQKLNILDELESRHGFGTMGTPRMAMTRLARSLSGIPVSERAEASVIYEIHSIE